MLWVSDSVERLEMPLLRRTELRAPAFQPALALGNLHTLAGLYAK
jgi:hypothetical protein